MSIASTLTLISLSLTLLLTLSLTLTIRTAYMNQDPTNRGVSVGVESRPDGLHLPHTLLDIPVHLCVGERLRACTHLRSIGDHI